MSVKLADNFQIREHSWQCLFHIINLNVLKTSDLAPYIIFVCYMAFAYKKVPPKTAKYNFCLFAI
jgi:hypothetical protein